MSARLWRTQCVNWKQSPLLPNLAQKLAASRAKKCRQTTSSLLENQTGVSMDIESQEAIKRSLPNAQTEKRLLAKK